MRLASFNLLHGVPVVGADEGALRPVLDDSGRPVGPPPVLDDQALRDAVRQIDPDVLGLQEVDVHQERSAGAHQVRVVAEELGARWWRFVPAVRGTPGTERDWEAADHSDHHGHDDDIVDDGPRYGVGLVSRLPVLEWHATVFDAAPWSLPLLVPASAPQGPAEASLVKGRAAGAASLRPRVIRVPDEPRVAVAAVVEGPTGPLTVVTTHLSFVPGYNVRQLRRLRRWLAPLPRPVILLGDFNLPGSLPRRLTGWSPLVTAPTYPSFRPRVQFDHVLADGLDDAVLRGATGRALALPVSDHCAVVVDLPLG